MNRRQHDYGTNGRFRGKKFQEINQYVVSGKLYSFQFRSISKVKCP